MANKKIQKSIEIVRSSTTELSSMSQASCDAIYELLKTHYATVGVSTVNNLADLERLATKQPDLVFMGMKYVPGLLPGTKVWISEYLDGCNINHTGSSKHAIEAEQSKPLAKQRVSAAGVDTSRSVVVKNGCAYEPAKSTLRFPMFVKPADLGGGEGIDKDSIAHNLHQLNAKVASLAAEHSADALVEEYLPGREFSVALLKDLDSNEIIVMPLELVAPVNAQGDPILSEEVKSANQEIVLAVTDPGMRARIIATATDAFNALGARDYGRIDIRLDAFGVPHFLEANLIPSLISGYGSFPKACVLNIQMGYEAMILSIVDLAFSRLPVDPYLETTSFVGAMLIPVTSS